MQKDSIEAKFDLQEVTKLLKDLQEATRANPNRDPDDYVPVSGSEIADTNYHHFVFGQRGAGKSSLLRHLEAEVEKAGRISAWLDQEVFSNLSYPDVLVSAVEQIFRSALRSVQNSQSQTGQEPIGFWQALWNRFKKPRPRTETEKLLDDLTYALLELTKLKFAPIDRKVEWTIHNENNSEKKISASATADIPHLKVQSGADAVNSAKNATTSKEISEGTKDQFLERSLTIYRDILSRASSELNGGFIFVDDLYQIRRSDQALVLGYLHRLVKDTGLWLKIGSIRYSTVPFVDGDPPRGMQIGHDAHEIALDRGMRHFASTQQFLERIMSGICVRAGVTFNDLFTTESRKRLVLAAGGVARDYLRIASAAILTARNRGVTTKTGSHRVIVEDVNKGAGSLASSKFADLRKDEPGESNSLASLVQDLTEFCRQTKCAYFLIAAEEVDLTSQVNKLQHLRFTHLVEESETIRDRGSQRFNVWLLDVAELSAQRATVGMDFLGWEDRSKRRNRKLVYTAGAGRAIRTSTATEDENSMDSPTLFSES